MKNRNGLVFALCAMLGAAGTFACSNESGDSGLVIEPESVSLAAYGTQSVKISGATASTAITVTSGNSACVSVNNADNLLADANGMANFLLAAANTDGKKCDTVITVTADGETKVINASVAEATGPAPDFVLTLDPNILDISGVGGEASTKITYKQGETPATGRTLKVSKVGGEDGCVEFSTSPVTNLNDGTVDFKVKALKDSCNVKLLIEDALTSITGEEKELSVYVGGKTDQKVEGTVKFIEPVDDTLEIIHSVGEGKFKVEVLDENSKALADTKVTLKNSNENCIRLTAKSITTDDSGVAESKVTVMNANCEATLTASAINKEASITIKVLDQDKFNINAKLVYDHPRFSEVNYVAVSLNEKTCAEIKETITDVQSYDNLVPDDSKEGITGVQPDLATFKLKDIESSIKSIFAYGKPNGEIDSAVFAYGCKDISVADHDTDVKIDMSAVMPDITGTYDIWTNFDLTSGFETTPCTTGISGICVPKVEVMTAGDWVRFVTNFCKSPLDTLLEFVWSNTLVRLLDIDALSGYTWLKSLIESPATKDIALNAVKPAIEKWLGESGEWYRIFNEITPDVADLTENMQLRGIMNVEKAEGGKIIEAEQKYTRLEYKWSYSPDGTPTDCINDTYGKEGDCRRKVDLGTVDSPINGNWTGTMYDNTSPMTLDIDKHKFNFKWITLLYTAVFGNILPDALDYRGTTVGQGDYIKALLEKLLFSNFIVYFNDQKIKDENGNAYSFDATDLENSCNNFILSLLILIINSINNDDDPTTNDVNVNGILKSVVEVVAGYACNGEPGNKEDRFKGLGALDDLVRGALGKLEASAEVKMSISSDACSIYTNNNLEIASFGEPDASFYTANEVLKDGSEIKSDRCTWDLDLQKSDGSTWATINGIFHATRQD